MLGSWVILFVYLVVFTNPPYAAILLLLSPLVALSWTISLVTAGVAWEGSPSAFTKSVGARVQLTVPWSEVAGLRAEGNTSALFATMSLVDKRGKTRVCLVTGAGLGFGDLQVTYESAAYYLKGYGIEAKNTLGWLPKQDTEGSGQARGERTGFLLHLSVSLVASGILILFTGSMGGRPISVDWAFGLTAAGLALLVVSRLPSRKVARSPNGTTRPKPLNP